jgi:hypothetical protein
VIVDSLLLARDQGPTTTGRAVADRLVDGTDARVVGRGHTFETDSTVTVVSDDARLRQVAFVLLATPSPHTQEGHHHALQVAPGGPSPCSGRRRAGHIALDTARCSTASPRSTRQRTARQSGSGLGLAIVAAIADAAVSFAEDGPTPVRPSGWSSAATLGNGKGTGAQRRTTTSLTASAEQRPPAQDVARPAELTGVQGRRIAAAHRTERASTGRVASTLSPGW